MNKILSIILILSALLLVAAYIAWDRGAVPLKQAIRPETRTYNVQNLKAGQAPTHEDGAIAPTPELYAPIQAQALPTPPTAAAVHGQPLAGQEGAMAPQESSHKPDCSISNYKYDPEQPLKNNVTNLKDAQFGCKINVKNLP